MLSRETKPQMVPLGYIKGALVNKLYPNCSKPDILFNVLCYQKNLAVLIAEFIKHTLKLNC